MVEKSCSPPDPDTRKPEYLLPGNACDAHCHVFGPASKFPYASGRSYTPPDAPLQNLQALHSILGVERAVIVQANCHGTDNRALLFALQNNPDKYRGIVNIDDNTHDSELLDMDEHGVRGIRFNFVKHLGGAPNLELLMRSVKRIEALGWHLNLHFDADDFSQNRDLLEKIPVPIVIDHMARIKAVNGLNQLPFQTLLQFMENEKNWVKISGAERITATGQAFRDVIPFVQALIERFPERIVWGTDWPHPNVNGVMPNDGDLIDLLPLYSSETEILHKILVENPAKLYGFLAVQ